LQDNEWLCAAMRVLVLMYRIEKTSRRSLYEFKSAAIARHNPYDPVKTIRLKMRIICATLALAVLIKHILKGDLLWSRKSREGITHPNSSIDECQ
jgi:hypothetical protein